MYGGRGVVEYRAFRGEGHIAHGDQASLRRGAGTDVQPFCGPRWSTAGKPAIVREACEADAAVSLVARRHGIARGRLAVSFEWSPFGQVTCDPGRH
ncbi:MAG: hypothetical protein BGO06_14180 [Shinella sp. 65-6]|nr:MAG: hypothetical protein BGO06_14180 [Shinella sp. 65-6]